MKKRILVLFILIAYIALNSLCLSAKQKTKKKNVETHYTESRIAVSDFSLISLGSFEKNEVKKYLKQTIKQLQYDDVNLIFVNENESLTGVYYTFQQTYKDVPIYSSYVRVKLDVDANIVSVIQNIFDISKMKQLKQNDKEVLARQKSVLTKDFLSKKELEQDEKTELILLFENENTAHYVLKIKGLNHKKNIFDTYFIDNEQNIIYKKDLNVYFAPKPATMETVTANVFLPDPLTSAEVVYGENGMYRNMQNQDTPELTAELESVEIDVLFENGLYKLESPYIKIDNFSPPSVIPYTSSTGDFQLTRSHDGFEDINTYYHINTYQEYIQSLGFDNVANEMILADTHAQNGEDQSFYTFQNGKHRLSLGDGHYGNTFHVDDAEDADVIIHEYAHAISNDVCSNCNSGTERNAIDEALGDYFATSYSRSINPFNWEEMFSWDGHNEFWAGRNVATDKHYPEDLIDDIYYQSEIFSAVLMEIWTDLGQEITDRLIIEAMFNFSANINMKTAASILLVTEQQLYGGEYNTIVYQHLLNRGLVDFLLDAGEPAEICLGDTIQLGGENMAIADNAQVYWSPGISLDDSTAVRPFATTDETTLYTLNVIDEENILYKDEVLVTVKSIEECYGEYEGSEIRMINTDRFLRSRGDLILELPAETEASNIRIFDLQGRLVHEANYEGGGRIAIDKDQFTIGVFLVRVEVAGEKTVFKVAKVR